MIPEPPSLHEQLEAAEGQYWLHVYQPEARYKTDRDLYWAQERNLQNQVRVLRRQYEQVH